MVFVCLIWLICFVNLLGLSVITISFRRANFVASFIRRICILWLMWRLMCLKWKLWCGCLWCMYFGCFGWWFKLSIVLLILIFWVSSRCVWRCFTFLFSRRVSGCWRMLCLVDSMVCWRRVWVGMLWLREMLCFEIVVFIVIMCNFDIERLISKRRVDVCLCWIYYVMLVEVDVSVWCGKWYKIVWKGY